MNDPASIESAIQQYLDAVEKSLADAPGQQRKALLLELRQHIQEAIRVRASDRTATLQDAYAVLSEMDLPDTYRETLLPEAKPREQSVKLVALALVCVGLQIFCLALTVAGIPVVGALGGFAAVVGFFLIWSNSRATKWIIWLAAIAAMCGVTTMILAVGRAL